MLGPPKPRRLDAPIAVSREDLVPEDHFYRHLEAKLDLCFVREWARELYAERGRPSIDPVVFFKLQLVMFFEGIRSERKLIETASLNLAHRWYLGYALDEELPDHSSLTRIRQRLGIDVFPTLLRADRRSLSGGRAGLGAGSFTSTPPRWKRTRTSIRSCRASTTRPRPTSPNSSPTMLPRPLLRPSRTQRAALPAGIVQLPRRTSARRDHPSPVPRLEAPGGAAAGPAPAGGRQLPPHD